VGYDLGVDLGTTFVAAAVSRGGRAEMCTLGNQTVVSPAVAYLNEQSALVFGEAAERRALSHPDRVERWFKRRLGDPTPVVLGGVPYQVTALMAAQLRDVLDKVAKVEGGPPDRVALTYPANWGPYRRELLEEIPHLAGLPHHVVLTEPEAAAEYYGASRQLGEGDAIAVYDLGGGTFDATVLRKQNGAVEVIGDPEGIERLGGIDFDEAIMQWINYSHSGALAELDMTDPEAAAATANLRQECVQAKEALSVDTETTIPVLLPSRHFYARLTRQDFEAMIRAPIESTIGTLVRAVHTARLDVQQLAAILLVGGSSRIPLIERMVAEATGRPIVFDAHPKYAVSLGAAMVAGRRPVAAGVGHTAASRRVGLGRATAAASGGAAPPAGAAPLGRAPAAATGGAAPPDGAAPIISHSSPSAGSRPTPTAPGAAAAGPPRQPGGSADPRRPARRSRSLWTAVAAAVVALLAAGVAVYIGNRSGPSSDAGASSTSLPPATSASSTARATPTVSAAVATPFLDQPVKLAFAPNYVAASPNGHQLYIAQDNERLSVVDTADNRVTANEIKVPGPAKFLSFSPDGRYAYVSLWDKEGGRLHAVTILDTTDDAIVKTIPVDTRPYLAAVTPDGRWLYVPNHDTHTVTVIDTRRLEIVKRIIVPKNPHYVSFSIDGKRAYVADHESNVISVIDTSLRKPIATIRVGMSPHSVEQNPRRPMVINVNWQGRSVCVINTITNKVRKTIPVGYEPMNVHWSPDGRYAYVVNNGSNSLSVIDANALIVTATLPTGRAPTAIAVVPDGSKGYVSNSKDNSLTVVRLAR
jgi:YVTN family beta-propeller protein